MIGKKEQAVIPTRFGVFNILAFEDEKNRDEYAVLVKGDIKGKENVLVRIHSGCITGDVFSSLKCDCREQLEESLKMIEKNGSGIVIYDQSQEGRGLGLVLKIKSYALEEKGLDTVQAQHSMGFSEDLRSYESAAEILKRLGVKSVSLLTNNPDKIKQLEKFGVKVAERIELKIAPNEHNKRYLETKKTKMGHLL